MQKILSNSFPLIFASQKKDSNSEVFSLLERLKKRLIETKGDDLVPVFDSFIGDVFELRKLVAKDILLKNKSPENAFIEQKTILKTKGKASNDELTEILYQNASFLIFALDQATGGLESNLGLGSEEVNSLLQGVSKANPLSSNPIEDILNTVTWETTSLALELMGMHAFNGLLRMSIVSELLLATVFMIEDLNLSKNKITVLNWLLRDAAQTYGSLSLGLGFWETGPLAESFDSEPLDEETLKLHQKLAEEGIEDYLNTILEEENKHA